MTYTENVFVLVMIVFVFFGAMCVLCYQLGKEEGREQAKAEMDAKQRKKGPCYTRTGRRPRIY